MTEANEVRWISGSVNSGRASKSSCEYSRMHTPGAMRPHRPERCAALAWLTGSIGSRCTLVRWLYREMRAVPVSTTYPMPGTVSEVSATFVARMIRRPLPRWKTRCCSAAESRANSGSTSVFGSFRALRASAASRISRSPEKKARMSVASGLGGASVHSSSTASTTPVTWSRSATTWRPSGCSSTSGR